MRLGIQRRRLDFLPVGVLPLRDHFPGVRRGDDFSAAVRRFLWRTFGGSIPGHDDFSPVAGGRIGLGVAEGSADVEMTGATNVGSPAKRQGIWVPRRLQWNRGFTPALT